MVVVYLKNVSIQQVLDYWELDYYNPCNTGVITNKSLQYHDPDKQGLGLFLLLRSFTGPIHPNNQGIAVYLLR